MIYRARKGQMSYGRPISASWRWRNIIPCPPGTVGNPTTFSYPVCYEIVKGAEIASLKDLNKPDSLHRRSSRPARCWSIRASVLITGNCGLIDRASRTVGEGASSAGPHVQPVAATVHRTICSDPAAKVGIMASSRKSLKPEHLALAAAGADIPTVLGTMDGRPHFRAAVGDQSGVLDFAKVEAEVVAVAQELVAQNPDVRSILFECTDLPPYAAAVQEAVGLSVFDVTTLIDHVVSALVRRAFVGTY